MRGKLATPGAAQHAQVSGRTGMQVFEAIFAEELPRPPIGDTLDFMPIHIEPGVAEFSWPAEHETLQPLGRGSRRLVRDTPRFGSGLRGALSLTCGQGLERRWC